MQAQPPHKTKPFAPFAVAGYGMLVVAVLLATWLSPVPRSDVAILVWPGQEARFEGVNLHRSGGDMIARSRWPNLIIARPNRPDFIARAYQHGAIFVFNPAVIAGCQA
jgi:hypothetical protein